MGGNLARPVAVLVIDLDNFKSINDRFGHATGDGVLQVFASSASAELRGGELIGRLGGEEFAVVLHDADRGRALDVADAIRAAFAVAAREIDGRRIDATVSIGVSVHDAGSADITQLLAQADQAPYLAKQRGQNCVELASLKAYMDRSATAGVPVPELAAKSAA